MSKGWHGVAALLIAGCGTSPRPPGWVAWVSEAPPPERSEIFGPPDRPGQAWITGHWTRRGDAWEWQNGGYVASPSPDAVWIPGCWVEKDGRWAWVPGSWRPSASSGETPSGPEKSPADH